MARSGVEHSNRKGVETRARRIAMTMKVLKLLAGALLAGLALHAAAQSYPTKPVHVVISFTPGSSTDIVGRIVIQKLTEMWGQPVVPENKAGAGGSIGSATVAKAAPRSEERRVGKECRARWWREQ